MKQHYLLIIFILFTVSLEAQIVEIPDANFKGRLIELGKDINGDGEIQTSEAEAVTTLYLTWPYSINSIEGIRNFTNIRSLYLAFQPIDNVDVSGLLFLEELDMPSNALTLDASGCTSLNTLRSFYEIESINVSGCTSLTDLNISSSSLSTIDFEGCLNMENIYINSSNLSGIRYYGPTCNTVF